MDEHWAPVYKFCSVCTYDFAAIVKFENLAEEESQLERHLGLEGKVII